jgi:peptidyl-dipeptidase A
MGNSTEFEAILDSILKEMMPFYEELHAFVRGRLCQKYPKRFDCEGPIPAHLLGKLVSSIFSLLDNFP